MEKEKPEPNIIDVLNQTLREKSVKDLPTPTVEEIAGSIGIDETTLYRWLHNDVQFATELHRVQNLHQISKEIEDKFPELAWSEEEKRIIGDEIGYATQIFFVIQGAKERHLKTN